MTVELVDFLPIDDPREEARRRLKHRARDLVLRDLDHEIRNAPKGSDATKFLDQVRRAVFD